MVYKMGNLGSGEKDTITDLHDRTDIVRIWQSLKLISCILTFRWRRSGLSIRTSYSTTYGSEWRKMVVVTLRCQARCVQ